jgi:flagellar hook-basal body complex protein FliE
MRKEYENKMRSQLQALRREYEELKKHAGQAETSLELEYYTLLEEVQIALESAEQKFELLVETHEDQWEHTRDEVERVWSAARDLVRAVVSP